MSEVEAHQLLLAKGQKVLNSMTAEGSAEKALEGASEWFKPGLEYVQRNAFEAIWSRDGLDKKYRSLVVISILASQGNLKQLESHVKIGLNNGLSEIEIREALMHVMGYCGFPRGLDALGTAEKVINANK